MQKKLKLDTDAKPECTCLIIMYSLTLNNTVSITYRIVTNNLTICFECNETYSCHLKLTLIRASLTLLSLTRSQNERHPTMIDKGRKKV